VICPLCNRRKARRHCPALGQQICAVCCGTKRLVEIRCPSSCGYLSASQAHPPAIVLRQQQRDLAVILPMLQGLSEAQSRLLLFFGSVIARYVPQDFQNLRDEDIAEAAASLASTFETAERGIIYEHRAGTGPAQHLAMGLRQSFTELVRDRPANAALDRDAALVLRRIEQAARDQAKIAGGGDTAYRDLLGRMLKAGSGDQPDTSQVGGDSNLIIP
jgi:hypothetical protein